MLFVFLLQIVFTFLLFDGRFGRVLSFGFFDSPAATGETAPGTVLRELFLSEGFVGSGGRSSSSGGN